MFEANTKIDCHKNLRCFLPWVHSLVHRGEVSPPCSSPRPLTAAPTVCSGAILTFFLTTVIFPRPIISVAPTAHTKI